MTNGSLVDETGPDSGDVRSGMLVEQLRLVVANVPSIMGGTVICIVAVMVLLDRVLPPARVWP